MAKHRIFHLAKESGLSSKETITALSDRGFSAKSHLCTVDATGKAVVTAYIHAKHKKPLGARDKKKLTRCFEQHKLFMDSSSLLKQRKAFDFFLNAVEFVKLTGNKVLIPKIIIRGIENSALLSGNQNLSRRVNDILSLLSLLSVADIIEICNVQRVSQVDGAFHTLFRRFIKEHDLLLITQDAAFAERALAFKRQKSGNNHEVYVKRISNRGELINLPPNKKSAPSPKKGSLSQTAAKKRPAKSARKNKQEKTRTIHYVPFYTNQSFLEEPADIKRIIVNGNPTNYCVGQNGCVYKIEYKINQNHCAEILQQAQQNIMTNNSGYRCVQLKSSGDSFVMTVHRLVALAFCDQTDSENKTVDHIDGDKLNNHYTNLEWVTQEENLRRAQVMQEKMRRADTENAET